MNPTLEEEKRKKDDLRPMYYWAFWIFGWFGGALVGNGKLLGLLIGYIIGLGGFILMMFNKRIKSLFGIK